MASRTLAGQRMLWVDDQINKLSPWISRFEENQVKVDAFETLADAYGALDETDYGVILLDQIMPGGKGSDAIAEVKARSPNSQIYICSAYFYLDDVIESIDRRQRQVGGTLRKIDKTSLPNTDNPQAVKTFLLDIFEDPTAPKRKIEAATQRLVSIHEESVIRWSDYQQLDMAGKLDIHDRVVEWTGSARDKLFAEGQAYLVFCGSWSRPVMSFGPDVDLPSDQELVLLAERTGFAPFAFSMGGAIDDLTPQCSAIAGARGYPFVRMERKSHEESVHLDSGNPLSLLSYERYTMNGWLDPIFTIDTHFAGELQLRGKHHRLANTIFTDSAETTRIGSLTAFSVLQWDKLRLATRCRPDCTQKRDANGEPICVFRTALLGRSLAQDLNCDFEMSFKSGKVRFR